MAEFPSLGPTSRSRSIPALVGAFLLLLASAAGYAIQARRAAARDEEQRGAAAQATAAAPAAPPAAPAPDAASPPPGGDVLLARAGLHRASLRMNGTLESNLVAAVGRTVGLPLTQVVVRALSWWVGVPGDFRRGDLVDVLFEERAGEEPLVHAVRLRSGKLSRYFRAYRYQPSGARFARFYQPDGSELEQRLEASPLDEYEQITSLLRDGRGHKGVDFRVPVGTPVKATFDGTITRRTWAFKANGNSLEVKEDGGQHRAAVFLHLAELPDESRVGLAVKRGQVIARSGNTGHSMAPHLHYQLAGPGQPVLDPFAGATTRRALPAEERTSFDAEVRRLDGLLDAGKPGT